MNGFRLIAILLISGLSASPAAVAADAELQFGWMPRMVFLSVDDPDGDTETTSEVQYLSALMVYELSRDRRLFTTLAFYDFELEPGVDEIGQNVKSTSLAFYYQSRLKLARHFKPWLGAGVVLNIDEFENREETDNEGFLLNSFSDRDETSLGLGLIAATEWEVSESISVGLTAEYLLPLSESLEGFLVGVSVLYH